MTSLEKALRDFAQFAAKLKGDEKSEAQTFLFQLLAAFGHDPNTLPEGSTFEYRVRSPRPSDGTGIKGEGQRTQFADFVWPTSRRSTTGSTSCPTVRYVGIDYFSGDHDGPPAPTP